MSELAIPTPTYYASPEALSAHGLQMALKAAFDGTKASQDHTPATDRMAQEMGRSKTEAKFYRTVGEWVRRDMGRTTKVG